MRLFGPLMDNQGPLKPVPPFIVSERRASGVIETVHRQEALGCHWNSSGNTGREECLPTGDGVGVRAGGTQDLGNGAVLWARLQTKTQRWSNSERLC